jgi:hypothetical protein
MCAEICNGLDKFRVEIMFTNGMVAGLFRKKLPGREVGSYLGGITLSDFD